MTTSVGFSCVSSIDRSTDPYWDYLYPSAVMRVASPSTLSRMTFRFTLFAALILTGLSISSCSDSSSKEPSSDTTSGVATESTPLPTMVDPSAILPTAQDPASAGPLNPAHGEPGHRCEIAVGAPLNSAPIEASTTITPGMTPGATPGMAPTPLPTNGSQRLNPAHGEPGHDCAVPVGSPLPG